MIRRLSTATTFVGAAVLGAAGGWWLARWYDRAHRHDLFAGQTHRRLAALGWIAGQNDPAHLSLLHDYVAWESVPTLRERARRIAAALEAAA